MGQHEGGRQRAFVVARQTTATTEPTWVIPIDGGADLHLDAEGRPAVDAKPLPNGHVVSLSWDGAHVSLTSVDKSVRLGGKRVESPCVLKPGDELQLPKAQVVIGVTVPLAAGGRRALTHHEFRERLYEEVARANRTGRSTSLVMLKAKAGEGRLITAAALRSFRAGDLVATYASDEPEFLLPDTDWNLAKLVMERLVESAGITAAVGVATAPAHGELPERLLHAARRALVASIEAGGEVRQPPPKPKMRGARVETASADPAGTALIAEVHAAVELDTPLVFVGESSAGKSVYARLLHATSSRTGHLVVRHGHAFGGSEALQEALVEAAGGTLFVEEIAQMSVADQALIDPEAFGRAKVRLVASTEHDLAALVGRGAFDRDLWELLRRHIVTVPPLRERPEDIVPLARRFASALSAGLDFSPGAIARLRSYPWPGNVLELRNAVERAVHLAKDKVLLAEHLPSEPMPIASGDGRLREHVDSVERDAIICALADSNHNQTHAAKKLGVSRRALIYKMEKYGLKRPPRSSR